MTRPWIKLHTTTLDDVRLLRLNERQQLRYYQMYLLAGRLNADGSFTENGERLNETDIAIKLRIADAKQFITDFKALKSAGLIKANGHGPYLAAFVTEQVDWSKKQEQERERKARQRGHDNVTRDINVTETKSRNRHALVTPLDQTKTKKKIKKEKKIKNPPPPKPSASKRKPATLVVGGGNSNHQTATAKAIHPIMRAAGLGEARTVELITKVEHNIEPGKAIELTLAALASVYADTKVENKPVVAAYRFENDQIPAHYFNKSTWQNLPAKVLKAAGMTPLSGNKKIVYVDGKAQEVATA